MTDVQTKVLRNLAARSNDGVLRGPAFVAADTIDAQSARIAELETEMQQERAAKWTLLESPLRQRIAELEGERDRQYEQNAEFIVKIAEFERALTEAVEWNWIDHWEGVDDQNSTRCIPESISGPILSLVRKETVL